MNDHKYVKMDREDRKAIFQERLGEELDRVTKELIDNAERLGWVDGMSTASMDRWIDTINAASYMIRAARFKGYGR